MSINVYINFQGDCRQAVQFYADVFKTEIPQIMTYGEVPPNPDYPMPEEAENLIMHTYLNINGSKVMFSDVFPGMSFTIGNNISLTLISRDMDEIKYWFDRLKEDGTVDMELQETFWSKCYGSVTDKYGVIWQFNYEHTN